jgi:hypothetical protein
MIERSWVQTPTKETIFRHLSFGSKPWSKKLVGNYPGIVAYAVILQKGGWTLRTVAL